MGAVLHPFFGVSQIRFWTHFWGSLAGHALPLLLVSMFGERLIDMLSEAPRELWVAAIGLGLAAVGLGLWALQRRRAGRRAAA